MKKISKILSLLVIFLLSFSLAACDNITMPGFIDNAKEKIENIINKDETKVTEVTEAKPTESQTQVKTETKAKETTKSTSKQTEEPFEPAVVYSGSVNGVFAYDEEEELYIAIIELAEWGNIQIDYEINEMESITIWYDNTDIVGYVTDEDTDGADWTANLYHEGDAKSFYCCLASGCTYEITYDPVMEELGVDLYIVIQEEADEPVDESLKDQFMVANYNTELGDYLVVYDSTYEGTITLSEYTIATDAQGYIIFASRTSDGYGGPADGFYHDGTYKWTAGELCGIFSLDADFNSWPNETEDGESAWTQYSVVCPEGYHIITGTKAQVAKIVKLLGNCTSYDSAQDNALFENVIEDGSLDNYQITYTKGDTCIGITYKEVERIKAEGIYIDTNGTEVTAMTKAEDGKYYGEYTLNQWNNITFTYSNGIDEQYKIWYDTCSIIGDVVKVNYGTTYGQGILYVDGGKWYRSETGEQNYSFTFDPATKELSIGIIASEEGLNFVCSGTVEKVKKNSAGEYVAVLKLAQWNHFYITYTDANGYAYPIWYTNTAISGLVTDAATSGCDETVNLYHENGELPGFYTCTGGDYKLVYNKEAGTLVVSEYVKKEEGIVATTAGTAIEAFSKDANGVYSAKYTLSDWNNIVLEYTNADEETITIWYDNTTISGDVTAADAYGCPWTNALYHEKDENGNEVKAWYHYGDIEPTNYVFTYDPANNTLVISAYVEGVSAATAGKKELSFTEDENGKYVGIYTIGEWNNIALTYTNSNNETITIWYDNTTISGDVTGAKADGCDWSDNLYHEGESKVWYHNGYVDATTYKFTYDPANGTLVIDAYYLGVNATTGATKVQGFAKQEDGTYVGTYKFGDWNNIVLYYVDLYGNSTKLWYNTCTVSGDGVNAETVTDAQYDGTLYVAEDSWYHDDAGATTYRFVYDLENGTLTINKVNEGIEVDTDATLYQGFELEDGVYTGYYTFGDWTYIALYYTNNTGEMFQLWYDTCAVSGDGVNEESVTDAQWNGTLYVVDNTWFHDDGGETSYKFEYNPAEGTLVISIYVPETEEADEPTDEDLENQFMIAEYNKEVESYAVVYDSTYEGTITLSEYTIATDAQGKIIFASRTSSGYGGPADGFYHDGTYDWTAGQVCGIFSLDADFNSWPNKTEGGESAWTQYSVVCPEGYHIITGSRASMAKLIKHLTNVKLIDANNDNTLFESVGDGSLNGFLFTYTDGDTCIGINVAYVKAEGVYVSTDGTAVSTMTKGEDGIYYGEFTLNQWNNILLTYSNGSSEKTLWYDTCTVLGDVVTKDTESTYGQGVLYIDSAKWYRSESGAQNYLFTYSPVTNTLIVSIKRNAEGLYVITGASNTSVVEINEGVYTITVTIGEWGGIYLDYVDADGNVSPIWFNNTTISGDVLPAETTGCDWGTNIYHENNTSSKFMSCTGGTYKFTYNPTEETLAITVVTEE